MNDLPTLTIHISPPDADEQSRLMLTLPDGKTNTGMLVLPFPLAQVPLLLRALNARQYLDYPHLNRLFRPDESEYDRQQVLAQLRGLGLLDDNGAVAINVHARVGKLLGSALLNDPGFAHSIKVLYKAAIHVGGGEIILSFDPTALALAALPWEVAHDGPEPLLMSKGIVLGCTRVMAFDHPPPPPRLKSNRLRVLTVAPCVQMDDFGQAFEQLARIRLRDALRDLPVDIEVLPRATMVALNERLAKDPAIDILDYYGHGSFENGSGALLLEDVHGQRDSVSASRLATLPKLPPLIVLHACHSAQLDIHELLTALAPTFSSAGVRAVVAMQLVTRMTAVTNSIIPIFYQELAAGCSVQRAIAAVRQALYTVEKDGASWFVPVLYLRQSDQRPYVVLARPALPPNPFAGPGAFVGREEKVKRLWDRLSRGGNLSIVGPSGSGKSTMLNLIVVEGKVRMSQETEVVRLPIQRNMKLLEAKLELATRLGGKKATDLTRLLKNKHLIILLDDLGVLDIGERGLEVRLWLRDLSQDRTLMKVQLVATSLRPLDVIFKGDNSPDYSPLHNVMADIIKLEEFNEDDGRRFIAGRLVGTPFQVEQFEDLLKKPQIPSTQTHPLIPRELENACRDRYDELCKGGTTS